MAVPLVAIVGRPNVGKSAIFNWLSGRRIAIVDQTSGVTRDRITTLIEDGDRFFELVDTGGMGVEDQDNLTAEVERQIAAAIEEADLLLFVLDVRSGVTPLDEEVARRLRYVDKPVIMVANKCDVPDLDHQAGEFYRLMHGSLVTVSATQNRNRAELLKQILLRVPDTDQQGPPPEAEMKIAIVGKRNTGKSTFINTLAHAERVIVSEIPGTTRDSVDVRFEKDGRTFVAIDTAGVRRAKGITESYDFYGATRTARSVRRADVVLTFLDPTTRISQVDQKLVSYVRDQYKPCLFVVNKWDLMLPKPTGEFADYLYDNFRQMRFVPTVFITAIAGRNVQALLDLAQHLVKQAHTRVSTAEINRHIQQMVEAHPPPRWRGRVVKIMYGTQVAVAPPTLVLFCTHPAGFSQTYRRYLLNQFRQRLPFHEVPIKLYLRKRHDERTGARKRSGGSVSDG